MPCLKKKDLSKTNDHSTKFVFMYRKHNSGKNLQHKYMQKIFWKHIRSKRFGNDNMKRSLQT